MTKLGNSCAESYLNIIYPMHLCVVRALADAVVANRLLTGVAEELERLAMVSAHWLVKHVLKFLELPLDFVLNFTCLAQGVVAALQWQIVLLLIRKHFC